MSYFVRMTDTFMSGWGPAKGKTNVYVVECDTIEEAEQIERAAHNRPEMRRIQICENMPQDREDVIYTHTHYDNLGRVWKED